MSHAEEVLERRTLFGNPWTELLDLDPRVLDDEVLVENQVVRKRVTEGGRIHMDLFRNVGNEVFGFMLLFNVGNIGDLVFDIRVFFCH